MNGVTSLTGRLPATYILKLEPRRTVPDTAAADGGETLLAAVTHAPRRQEISQLSALLPEVLARYGIAEECGSSECFEAVA